MYLSVGVSARWLNNFPSVMSVQNLKKQIFNIRSESDFAGIALEVFNYQFENNPVYRKFVQSLGKIPSGIKNIRQIPFLPVEFFRNHRIITGILEPQIVFESSGTTGVIPGRHFVVDASLYEESFLRSFRHFYGDPENLLIAALLPSYTERTGSSLVYMADHLIKMSAVPGSGFYKDSPDDLIRTIKSARAENQKVLLLGVSFALLDIAENQSPDLSGIIVMETGGMKGRRKELTRTELHSILKERLNLLSVHSEYGMTELLSQAYSSGDGIFYSPPWMKIVTRDPQDPLTILTEPSATGGINIIDLANLNSCCFIATGDLGKIHEDSGFEVLGRFDNSDIRGCNLMVE
jgi:phenylacetate-coenzyme A ligase PaaK-like adenylate-forming protein